MCSTERRGVVLIYTAMTLGVLLGFTLLVVDGGRLRFAKTQAQDAADAVALAAATDMVSRPPASVRTRAVRAAADNTIDGVSVAIDPNQDVEFGVWDPQNTAFAPMPAGMEAGATAVRVSVLRTSGRGTSVPLVFGRLFGVTSGEVRSSAIAVISRVSAASVPGKASPWLAGLPAGASLAPGSRNPAPSTAPDCSPVAFPVSGGTTLRFATVSGTTSWNGSGGFAGAGSAGADGDTTTISAQPAGYAINTTRAPLGAMMGIFLDAGRPDATAMNPTILDYTTPASRDFASFAPQLKQVFFIGNGLDSAGNLQKFTAPAGATRLFVGMMDEKGWWWDNVGSVQFTVNQGTTAVLVQ